jgi:polyribonucleotide nucleotidyltransferase
MVNWIVNPTRSQLKASDLEFLIAATEKNLMMVEGEAKECAEADLVKCSATGTRCDPHPHQSTG